MSDTTSGRMRVMVKGSLEVVVLITLAQVVQGVRMRILLLANLGAQSRSANTSAISSCMVSVLAVQLVGHRALHHSLPITAANPTVDQAD